MVDQVTEYVDKVDMTRYPKHPPSITPHNIIHYIRHIQPPPNHHLIYSSSPSKLRLLIFEGPASITSHSPFSFHTPALV